MQRLLKRYSISEYIILIGVFLLVGIISLLPEPVLANSQKIIQAGLILFLGFLIYPIKSKRKFFLNKNEWLLWLFVFSVSTRLLSVLNLEWAIHRYYLFIIPGLLLYFIGKALAVRQKTRSVFYSLCIFGTIVAIIGIAETIFKKNIIYEYLVPNTFYYRYIISFPRIMSTQLHPAVLGTFMIACIGSVIFLFLNSKKPWLAETGIIGLLSLMGFLVLKLKKVFQLLRFKKADLLNITVFAILFGLLINFNTYDALYWMSPLYLFWIFVGLINGQDNHLLS